MASNIRSTAVIGEAVVHVSDAQRVSSETGRNGGLGIFAAGTSR
jgi:hypothetical protein